MTLQKLVKLQRIKICKTTLESEPPKMTLQKLVKLQCQVQTKIVAIKGKLEGGTGNEPSGSWKTVKSPSGDFWGNSFVFPNNTSIIGTI